MLRRSLRLLRDRKGLAALEFALIAPMMVITLFGAIEVTELMATNRRAEVVAGSVADVVSRDTSISNAELADLWSAARTLMYPNSAGPLRMRVTSVQINSSSDARVLWSEGYNGYAPRASGSPVSLPNGMMLPGTSVVLSETSYIYTPPIGVFLDITLVLDHVEYRRPRIADPVTRN